MAKIDFCEYVTGLPPVFYDLLIAFETTGEWTQFYVDDTVEVDWGSGHYLTYGEGIVYGRQVNPYSDNPVLVRSSQDFQVKTLRFGNGSDWDNIFLSINILKAVSLTDATKMCYRLEAMHTFTFFGNNQIKSFESAWEDCTELLKFEGMDTTRATTFRRTWKNANKLIVFPSVYARECVTVEEAWMGCTSMVEFPVIDVSNCIDFRSAWRGNVALIYFPYIDISSGENFDHTWAYTTKLSYFPALSFGSALNMDYTFAYMKRVTSLGFINSRNATTFQSTFRKMLELKCIGAVDTNSIASRLDTENMFLYTDNLVNPTEYNQERIRDGYRYINDEPCYYNAGRSTFFIHCQTDGEETSFEVIGGDFEVDWGDGLFLPYNEGFVSDIPIAGNAINIKSEENITQIIFHNEDEEISDRFTSIEIKRGRTLKNVTNLCKNLTKLEYFEILGIVDTTDFTGMLEGCINLTDVGELYLGEATSVKRLFYNNEKLISIEENQPVDVSKCTDFYEMFYGCKAFVHLQKIMSPLGEDFTRTFSEMTLLECLDGIDTRNQTTTYNMFVGSDIIIRPNGNEQGHIEAGFNYDNLGNCGGAFSFNFTGNDAEVTFQIDAKVIIDWGDANFIEYFSNIPIVGTPINGSTVYVIGDAATSIIFTSDNFVDVEFTHTENITSMNSMFKDKTTLNKFSIICDNNIEDFESAFENSSITEFESTDFNEGTVYTNMFKDTASLVTVNNMNTVKGIAFEGMFFNSAIQCIGEIDTCLGNFPPSYIDCVGDRIACDSTIVCVDEYFICPVLACNSYLDRFGDSSMFTGATSLISPDLEQQTKITNRFHYVGVEPC